MAHYGRWRRQNGKHHKVSKEYQKSYGRSLAGRYSALRRAAKDLGIPLCVSPEEHHALLMFPCDYCAGPLNGTGSGLDRIDSSLGYAIGNVVPCCVACNRIKNVYLTHAEMKAAMAAVLALRNS